MPREKLGDILIRAGLLDEKGLQRALNEQQRWGGQLGRYLVELGLISEEILVRALSTQYKVPAITLEPSRLDKDVANMIPRDIAEKFGLIAFRVDHGHKFLDVAMNEPSNPDAIDMVRVATKHNVRPYIASPSAIEKAIAFIYYGDLSFGDEIDLSPDSSMRLDSRGSELLRQASEVDGGPRKGRSAPPPTPTLASLAVVGGRANALDVKVSVGGPPPAIALPDPRQAPQNQAIQPPKASGSSGEEGFHITMDVPAVDKEPLAQGSLESRVATLDSAVQRNNDILRRLLEALTDQGILTKKQLQKVLDG